MIVLPHVTRAEVEPLLGRTIVADKPCPACGDRTATIEPHHYHLADLPCAACGRRGRWLSHWQAWRLLHPGQEWFQEVPTLLATKGGTQGGTT
jgi:hypothetical protein